MSLLQNIIICFAVLTGKQKQKGQREKESEEERKRGRKGGKNGRKGREWGRQREGGKEWKKRRETRKTTPSPPVWHTGCAGHPFSSNQAIEDSLFTLSIEISQR